MAQLAHRRDIILSKASDNDAQPVSGATVHVLPPGGIVSSVSYTTVTILGVLVTYTDFTLQAGHGFSAGQRFIIGTNATTFGQIASAVSTNVLRAIGTYSAASGDVLVNLGSDTGSTAPSWDDATIPICSTMDGSGTALTPSRVTTNSDGEYEYWMASLSTQTIPLATVWEIIRSGASVIELIQHIAITPDVKSTGSNNADFRVWTTTAKYLIASIGTENRFTIRDEINGNSIFNIKDQQVGIGTTTPSALLDVRGTFAAKTINGAQYAHLYATSGTGTEADPWVTSGSNPVQAAISALPATGGTVYLKAGWYDLGTADPAVTIPVISGWGDDKQVNIIGEGMDLVTLNYRGTGTAIRYWQDHTGSPGSSVQSNANTLRGFSIEQTTNARQGNGIFVNYATRWTFEDLSIGTKRANRQTTDRGFAVGLRMDERSVSYQTVDDFNTVNRCYFSGNILALKANQQADSLRITNCYFEGNPNINTTQSGVLINNSAGVKITGNTFNFFDYLVTDYAIKLDSVIRGATVESNYFERNGLAVFLSATQNHNGIRIASNFFAIWDGVTRTGAGRRGIEAGVDGTFRIAGLIIEGNAVEGIFTGVIGINIRPDVKDFILLGNGYVTDGSQYTANIAPGARGMVLEGISDQSRLEAGNANAGAANRPTLVIYHDDPDYAGIRLHNPTTTAENSPRFQLIPGGTSSFAMSQYCDASGNWRMVNKDGNLIGAWSQDGDITQNFSSLGYAREFGQETQEVVIAAAASTDTTIDLPANSVIDAVVGRVNAQPPGTATFTVGDPTTAARFATGISTANGTTFVGLTHVDQTGAAGPRQTSAAKIRLTPNAAPSDTTGRIRVTVYYQKFTAPTA